MAHECGFAFAIMKEHYFDDLKVGDRFKSEPLSVTEKQLVEFAHKFDPQMFHLSRKTAERTIFKGLIASGWHTAAMTMRQFVQTLNFAEGAIGLGVDELRWPNVVRPGDVLTVETEIVDLRPSRSRPGYGTSPGRDSGSWKTRRRWSAHIRPGNRPSRSWSRRWLRPRRSRRKPTRRR